MATLALTAGVSTLGLTGFSLFGANLAATALGTFIDGRLFGGKGQQINQEGPRLKEFQITTSTEGAPIPRLFGRVRIGGNLIWATNLTEIANTSTQRTGGKGGGGGSITTTEYVYLCSFAIAFCEGNERTYIGRIWADGQLLDTSAINFRFYPGTSDQLPDDKIVQIEGAENAPAFREIAYIVFEDLDLTKFGNRIPQISAEIISPAYDEISETLENLVESVNLIPSTGEVSYGMTPQVKSDRFGNSAPENIHLSSEFTDAQLSLENLTLSMPKVESVNLVVSWFGTDLRMDKCEIEPRVEVLNKLLQPTPWSVSGKFRSQSNEVSQVIIDGEERPVFGGTPSDHSIVECLTYLCQSKTVDFYPFLLMDIPPGNPMEQPVYPWRGRIKSDNDGTATAQADVDSFFGSATASDFTVNGTSVSYTGLESDKGVRRMIIHYALLISSVVNTLEDKTKFRRFYVGTEMVGVTQTRRDGVGNYPGVAAYNRLIDDVKAIFVNAGLGSVEVSYAADWSEYHSHRPNDGTNDVFFNMDPIWSNPNCSVIAIDNYCPMSDWRDGQGHLDYGNGVDLYGNPRATTVYDLNYLRGQIEGGELYDYFYASSEDRNNQNRTPIVDTGYGKDWVFRQKDFRNWWISSHYNRPSGVESTTATSWSPRSKKIVFSECGSPAVDKGTNQPNVFFDPKSSESFLPYFSNGNRDDQIQRVYYEALITYWRDNSPSGMIIPSDITAWTWDARPYPAFPYRNDIWSDGDNYQKGHWLNGRVGSAPLAEVVKKVCSWVGIGPEKLDLTGLIGANTTVRGFMIESLSSPRDILSTLASAFFFDAYESEGKIKFKLRANTQFSTLEVDDLVTSSSNVPGFSIQRDQETELPYGSKVSFIDESRDYQVGSTGSQVQTSTSSSEVEIRLPINMTESYAKILSEIVLLESWSSMEVVEFSLPISYSDIEPGDGLFIDLSGNSFSLRVVEVSRGEDIQIVCETVDTSIYQTVFTQKNRNSSQIILGYGRTVLHFVDLPLIVGDEESPWAPRIAAYQGPFPPAVTVYENIGSDLVLRSTRTSPTQMGFLAAGLPRGPSSTIDEGNILQVDVNDQNYQVLGSSEDLVRNGSNLIAVKTSSGDWEVMKFVDSSFQGDRRYNLSRLIRGQYGTEAVMEDLIPEGSPVVFLLPDTLSVLDISQERKNEIINYRYGPNVYPTSSPFFVDVQHQGRSTGLVPYPVANITFTKKSATMVEITWKRQTRFGGQGIEPSTVPLNELDERYDVEIYDGSMNLVQSVQVTSPSHSIDPAPAGMTVVIYQISAEVGRGRRSEKTYA